MIHRSKSEPGAMAGAEAPLALRLFRDDDLDAVVELWRACDLVVPRNDPARDIAFCRASLQSGLFVGEIEERVVASAMAGHDGHRGWLYYVAVAPERRGAGLGRRIVDHAEAWLASLGVRKVNLMIRETNDDAQGFYERLGYVVEPRTVMARRLAAGPVS